MQWNKIGVFIILGHTPFVFRYVKAQHKVNFFFYTIILPQFFYFFGWPVIIRMPIEGDKCIGQRFFCTLYITLKCDSLDMFPFSCFCTELLWRLDEQEGKLGTEQEWIPIQLSNQNNMENVKEKNNRSK